MAILPKQSHDKYRGSKFSHISRDVRGPSWIIGLSNHFYDRDRSLRRNARNPAPNELVQHEITDDQDALIRKIMEEFLGAFELHYLSRHILKLRLLKEKFPSRIECSVTLKT